MQAVEVSTVKEAATAAAWEAAPRFMPEVAGRADTLEMGATGMGIHM